MKFEQVPGKDKGKILPMPLQRSEFARSWSMLLRPFTFQGRSCRARRIWSLFPKGGHCLRIARKPGPPAFPLKGVQSSQSWSGGAGSAVTSVPGTARLRSVPSARPQRADSRGFSQMVRDDSLFSRGTFSMIFLRSSVLVEQMWFRCPGTVADDEQV